MTKKCGLCGMWSDNLLDIVVHTYSFDVVEEYCQNCASILENDRDEFSLLVYSEHGNAGEWFIAENNNPISYSTHE